VFITLFRMTIPAAFSELAKLSERLQPLLFRVFDGPHKGGPALAMAFDSSKSFAARSSEPKNSIRNFPTMF